MAIVIDEHGGTAGIVSIEDLVEEVVGDIDDGRARTSRSSAHPDGSILAAGTVRLDELGQAFGESIEHEEVDSVSGLVLARLGRPPVVGDAVEYSRVRMTVTAMAGRGVAEVRATAKPPGEEEEPDVV